MKLDTKQCLRGGVAYCALAFVIASLIAGIAHLIDRLAP